jgi:hypothetical protein
MGAPLASKATAVQSTWMSSRRPETSPPTFWRSHASETDFASPPDGVRATCAAPRASCPSMETLAARSICPRP